MSSKIIVALDFPDDKSTMQLVDQLEPDLCRLKVGKELFTRCGPDIVRKLVSKGYDVFLDLKFHDIPNTVARACEAAAELGVWMLNVHSMGGHAMMEAARSALNSDDAPMLIAVTLLTSNDDKDLAALGIQQSSAEFVSQQAGMAHNIGLDGVVCSAAEATMLKQKYGKDFKLITPGIRLQNTSNDDQKRVVTPKQAISNGADYLVIGRPIAASNDPCRVLRTILSEIA
jgi:orotidine-5'-phosphate decarboxylase